MSRLVVSVRRTVRLTPVRALAGIGKTARNIADRGTSAWLIGVSMQCFPCARQVSLAHFSSLLFLPFSSQVFIFAPATVAPIACVFFPPSCSKTLAPNKTLWCRCSRSLQVCARAGQSNFALSILNFAGRKYRPLSLRVKVFYCCFIWSQG